MKKDTNEKKESTEISNSVTKWIALGITGAVLAVTIYIAIHSLYCSKAGSENIVLHTLIPLWGTWIGTVLAFYFGKNNFDAATQSYQDVIKQLTPDEKLGKLLVKDYMTPIEKMKYLNYNRNQIITKILDNEDFKECNYNRFVFLDDKGVAKYIIHRSLFNQFIASKISNSLDIKSLDIKKIQESTLKNMEESKDEDIQSVLKNSFAVVSINATLLEAKKKIELKKGCLDLFVTENGAENERVIGLITNNELLKAANI